MRSHLSKEAVPSSPIVMEGKVLALACAQAAWDKKAEDILILDMRSVASFTDFFVICSAASDPQLKAIAASIRSEVREQGGLRPHSEDGVPTSQWVVIDYSDVIVHIFHTQKREYYRLEDLWNDAPKIDFVP